MSSDAEQILDATRRQIETRLEEVLPTESDLSQELVDAMRYSVMNGGKRLRGLLVCVTASAFGADVKKALDCAVAIELIHAYSLVHDDLPAMDNAETRRGKPSCHVVFGDDMATLVGDALQPLAFSTVLRDESIPTDRKLPIVSRLANASGFEGMVGGQAWDMRLHANKPLTLEEIRRLQGGKTGALFVCSVEMGYILARGTAATKELANLQSFAQKLGEGFQVVDDILDLTQSRAELGKPTQRDEDQGKTTVPSLIGLKGAREHSQRLLFDATHLLDELGVVRGSPLSTLTKWCVDRLA